MVSPFPSNNPSWLRETTSTDHDSIWEGPVSNVWRSGSNQWQATLLNNRGENRDLVITRVERGEAALDFAEFGRISLTETVQQYWMSTSCNWNGDTDFFYVHAEGREISGQRIWEANFQLPKAYNGLHDPSRVCPHPAWT